MNISSQNVSFKSKIKVLHVKDFDKVTNTFAQKGGKYIDYGYTPNITKGYTCDVRTCTAGFIADAKKKIAPLFFHLYDWEKSLEETQELEEMSDGTNAIIAGSKPSYIYSIPLFEKIKRIILDKKLSVTILQSMDSFCQTHLAYDSETDTAYLSVEKQEYYTPKTPRCVKSMAELKEIFKEVHISPTDTIEFYKEGEFNHL